MAEPLFVLGHVIALPIWALMIFAPRWRWTERVVGSILGVLLVAVVYALALFAALATPVPTEEVRLNLDTMTRFLGTPVWATAAWLHLLAFDLFVGHWVYLDSRKRNVNAWVVSPILVLVFIAGPLGLLEYALLCLVRRGSAKL